MATHFRAEQMDQIRQAAGVEDAAPKKNRETFAVATTEVPASTETQSVSVDEMDRQSHHAVALDLAAVKAQIAAMDSDISSGAMPAERVVGPKDARALDMTEIHEQLDMRDAGLSGGFFTKLRNFFRTRT